MVGDHLLRIADRGQVVRAIPFVEQGDVLRQLGPRRDTRVQLERGESCDQRCRHAESLAAGGVCGRKPRLRWTSSKVIAAGVMPEMRFAWPIVSGRCWLSFC